MVRDLQNFVDEVDNRFRDQEVHARKDSVGTMNTPFDANKNETLAEEIIFFKCIWIINASKKVDVVYHNVPSRKLLPAGNMPTVIIKFVRFHKKALIMKNGHKLISIKYRWTKYIYIYIYIYIN